MHHQALSRPYRIGAALVAPIYFLFQGRLFRLIGSLIMLAIAIVASVFTWGAGLLIYVYVENHFISERRDKLKIEEMSEDDWVYMPEDSSDGSGCGGCGE